MSERYQRLFALPQSLYTKGAPVVVEAGALLKDTRTGHILAQLKIKNIEPKTIKAALVEILPLDTVGKSLGETVEYQYLDLAVGCGQSFGVKEAVAIPKETTRGFTVAVAKVIYADNSDWVADGTPWEPLPVVGRLEDWLQDCRVAAQFQVEYGARYQYAYWEAKDVWACPCGRLNRKGQRCSACGAEAEAFLKLDTDALVERYEKRIAEESAADKAKEDANRIRAKRTKRLVLTACGVFALVALTAVIITNLVIPLGNYNSAVAMRENGDYEGAIAAFTELGHFRDSKQQVLATYYAKGEKLLVEDHREEASAAFSAADGYKDAADRAAGIPYMEVSDLIDAGEIHKATVQYNLLRGGKPAPESANKLVYAKAKILYDSGDYINAEKIFGLMDSYMDSADLHTDSAYNAAQELAQNGEYDKAISLLSKATDQQSIALADECRYQAGKSYYNEARYLRARDRFEQISDKDRYEDVADMMIVCSAYSELYNSSLSATTGYLELETQADVEQFKIFAKKYNDFVLLAQEHGIVADDTAWTGKLKNTSKIIEATEQGLSWYGRYLGEYSPEGTAMLTVNENNIHNNISNEVVCLRFAKSDGSLIAYFYDGASTCNTEYGVFECRLTDTGIAQGTGRTWTHIRWP